MRISSVTVQLAVATAMLAPCVTACRTTDASDASHSELRGATTRDGCIFGATLNELDSSLAFASTSVGRENRALRDDADASAHWFAVSQYRHLQSDATYRAFVTFDSGDDGGNTRGWIEDHTGAIVARIEGDELTACALASSPVVASTDPNADCLFGGELDGLDLNPAFERKNAANVVRHKTTWQVQVLRHRPTSQQYLLYRHSAAGSSGSVLTTGWLEAAPGGDVVATIDGGELFGCLVSATGARRPSLVPTTGCGFGRDLTDLESSDDFTTTDAGEVTLPARLRADDGRPRTFRARRVTHNASGNRFMLYSTFRDSDDDGATLGWIELENHGAVVAEIRDGAFYACRP